VSSPGHLILCHLDLHVPFGSARLPGSRILVFVARMCGEGLEWIVAEEACTIGIFASLIRGRVSTLRAQSSLGSSYLVVLLSRSPVLLDGIDYVYVEDCFLVDISTVGEW
jgi:hypothetical protein